MQKAREKIAPVNKKVENLCFDCPRMCGVNREKGIGFCGEDNKIRVAKVIENFMWEEPCISGKKGALAIFFSGCNLRCEFCQNYQISHIGKGEKYSPEEFKRFLESFDQTNFASIDLITPTHFSSLLFEALKDFKHSIPIVWNSSGYENVDTIKKISAFADVFLPDFKFYDSALSKDLALAPDYFQVASAALKEMNSLRGENIFKDGVLTSGMLIRHLILPGHIDDSYKILQFIKDNIKNPFISLMGQFTPLGGKITKRLKPLEYKLVCSFASKLGLNNGYVQELTSAREDFIPNF